MRTFVLGLALAAILAGCVSTAGPSASPQDSRPAPSVPPPTAAAAITCDPLDLRLPSGEPLDLTGTWRGNDDGLYQVRQYGECVWWVGQTRYWVHVLQGTVTGDLTVSATWATVATSSPGNPGDPVYVPPSARLGHGTILLRIEVAGDGTNATLRLIKVSGTDSAPGGIRTTEWSRVDDDPDHPLPSPAS
jgi:hypothetical protein